MEKEVTNLTIRKDIKTRAIETVNQGFFPGISSLSGLVELALERVLNSKEVPVEVPSS